MPTALRGDRPLIAVVDYGMGNLRSVSQALSFLSCRHVVTACPEDLDQVVGIMVPGVGAFPDAMERLNGSGLSDAIKRQVAKGKPLLGICLGLQILFETGEEAGGAVGLGLLPGRVVRLAGPEMAGLKVPHMGWDTAEWSGPFPLLKSIASPAYFYFVHSYCIPAPEGADGMSVASCTYGKKFIAAVQRGNVMGTQFHPEKSGRVGLEVLKNFLGICHAERTAESGGAAVGGGC